MDSFSPVFEKEKDKIIGDVSYPIEVENLSIAYEDFIVLEGISFFVETGAITTILGGSGCGKSSLLKTLVGLHPPRSGKIKLLGTLLDEKGWPAQMKANFGVLFQGSALFNSMTIQENVALPLIEIYGWPIDEAFSAATLKLELVGLGRSAKKLPGELSGGMKKRAGLARALIHEPQLLFCDEPGAGLDPVTSAELDELLINLKNQLGTTIIVVTHELDSIKKISDQVLMLGAGSILSRGSLEQVLASPEPAVQNFFNRKPQTNWEDSFKLKPQTEPSFAPEESAELPKPRKPEPESTDNFINQKFKNEDEYKNFIKKKTIEDEKKNEETN